MKKNHTVVAVINELAEAFGGHAEIARALGIKLATIAGWVEEIEQPSPEVVERIAGLWYVWVRLTRVFHAQAAMDWLLGINRFLQIQRPLDLLMKGRVREVNDALDQTLGDSSL